MIDEKKIEEAKRAFIADKKILGVISIIDLSCGFKEGAHWAIEQFLKDLWHHSSEIPHEGKYLVVEHNITDTIKEYISFKRLDGYVGYDWVPYCKSSRVARWLYVDDLLPKKKGGEK